MGGRGQEADAPPARTKRATFGSKNRGFSPTTFFPPPSDMPEDPPEGCFTYSAALRLLA